MRLSPAFFDPALWLISQLSEPKKVLLSDHLFQVVYNFPALGDSRCDPFRRGHSETVAQTPQRFQFGPSFLQGAATPFLLSPMLHPPSEPRLREDDKPSVSRDSSHSYAIFMTFIISTYQVLFRLLNLLFISAQVFMLAMP